MRSYAQRLGLAAAPVGVLRRKCACGGGCDSCRLRRSARDAAAPAPAVPESVNETLRSSGRPLDAATRATAERHFEHSFANVRVHTDARAAESADAVGAHAYTVGDHVAFARDRFAPGTRSGWQLLAHELAHVVQQERSPGAAGAAPQAHSIAPADDPYEREADAMAAGATGSRQAPSNRLFAYRDKGKETIAFGALDEPGLKEEQFRSKKKQPFIEHIDVDFTGAADDVGHASLVGPTDPKPRMPTGKLKATYHKSALPDITVDVVGGSTLVSLGLTDHCKDNKVTRLEGSGYTDSASKPSDPVSTKGKGARYSKSGAGTMNFAIFFRGIQAIHHGFLNTGSHACVHVGDGNIIKQLNYHSVIGTTTVSVKYSSSVLKDLCCRRREAGNPNWDRNPCESVKASSCPKPSTSP